MRVSSGDGSERPIFLAGIRAFSELGYHGASTRRIASQAGMSPAALYIHFPTKGDLLAALVISGLNSLLGSLRTALDEAGPGSRLRTRALVGAFVRWHAANSDVARVIQYESRHLPEAMKPASRRVRGETQALFLEEISGGVERGLFNVLDVRIATTAILSMGLDVARWYPDRPTGSPDSLADDYAEFAMRILDGKDADPQEAR